MPNNPCPRDDGLLVWHPDVHERFRERLFFFLLAMKPYREGPFRHKLVELLKEFGIPTEEGHEGYCSYVVLGDFDHLLRVWLPAQGDTEFIKRARAQIPNLKAILQFTVQSVILDWRFPKGPTRTFVNELTADKMRKIQSSRDPAAWEEVLRAHAAYQLQSPWGTNANRQVSSNSIKAFISLQPPANADDSQREFIQNELVQLFKNSKGISGCTFYLGVGFTWFLVKFVAEDFSHLANLVSRISTDYGGFGISTSTYAAISCLAEGDAIGSHGFASEHAFPPAVKDFLPALSGPTLTDEGQWKDIARYVEENILPRDFSDFDRKAFRELLNAVLQKDEASAATALYFPTVQAERQIRNLLKKVVGMLYGGNLDELAKFFQQKKLDFKTIETVPLGSVLIAARDYAKKVIEEWQIPLEFADSNFQNLAKTRNRLMHGDPLNLPAEWRSLADHLAGIVRVRDELTLALEKCLRKLSASTK